MKPDTLEQLLTLPAEEPEGLILSFDFGLRRIGCAIGQMVTATASPLKVLTATAGIPNWGELQELVHYWQPQVLLVGIPFHLDGQSQPITTHAFEFALQLRTRFALPVYGVDEVLTSIAAENLIQSTEDKIMRKQSLDSVSAKIILEKWFALFRARRGKRNGSL